MVTGDRAGGCQTLLGKSDVLVSMGTAGAHPPSGQGWAAWRRPTRQPGGLKIKRQPFGEENSPHTAGEGNTSIARCRKRLERVPGNTRRVPRSRSRPGGSRILTDLGAIRACRDV